MTLTKTDLTDMQEFVWDLIDPNGNTMLERILIDAAKCDTKFSTAQKAESYVGRLVGELKSEIKASSFSEITVRQLVEVADTLRDLSHLSHVAIDRGLMYPHGVPAREAVICLLSARERVLRVRLAIARRSASGMVSRSA